MSYYSSITHDCTDEYKDSIFSGLVVSPHPVRNTTVSFILLYLFSPSVSTVTNSSVILDDGLPEPRCWLGIWRWWITIFFSSNVLYIMPLTSVLFCVYGITTGNESVSPSGVWGASLSLCGTIIFRLNFYPRSPLIKLLFLVIIGTLFFCRNGHENMVLHATPYPRSMDTVTVCPLTTKGAFKVITAVMSNHTFSCSIYFPTSNPLILNGFTSSISFKCVNFNTRL